MARQLTEADARNSLEDHARTKGHALREKYGILKSVADVKVVLEDREFVRYPCTIAFDADPLDSVEFAFPVPISENPNDGFVMSLHPVLADHPEWTVQAVLYQLVAVNYGDFAAAADAEAFGAAALGLTEDRYYSHLCELSDAVQNAAGCTDPSSSPG